MDWNRILQNLKNTERGGNWYFAGYFCLTLLGLFHLVVHFTGETFTSTQWSAGFCFLTGLSWLVATHLFFFRLMKLAFPVRHVAPLGIHHVLPVESSTVKVILSSENELHHQVLVPWLREAFQMEMKTKVEIVSRSNAKDTLCCVTDNVVDLVILTSSFSAEPMDGKKLCAEIKRLDKSIPVIGFGDFLRSGISLDGIFEFPQSQKDIQPLANYIRGVEASAAKR